SGRPTEARRAEERPAEERPVEERPADVPSAAERTGPARAPVEPEPAPRAAAPPPASPRLAAGRERVATLRGRLAAAARPPVTEAEPKRAAAAVMEVVEDLRARLDDALRERGELAGALDEAQAQLQRVETELRRERKLREAVEARSEERARVAEEAV